MNDHGSWGGETPFADRRPRAACPPQAAGVTRGVTVAVGTVTETAVSQS